VALRSAPCFAYRGIASIVSKVLSGKRDLNKDNMRKIITSILSIHGV
jgi:hypothetical protein